MIEHSPGRRRHVRASLTLALTIGIVSACRNVDAGPPAQIAQPTPPASTPERIERKIALAGRIQELWETYRRHVKLLAEAGRSAPEDVADAELGVLAAKLRVLELSEELHLARLDMAPSRDELDALSRVRRQKLDAANQRIEWARRKLEQLRAQPRATPEALLDAELGALEAELYQLECSDAGRSSP